jgi:hypothetical protein
MARRQRLQITPALLLAAWQRRRRPHWPDTYLQAMADPLLSRLVRAQAVGLAQAEQRRTAAPFDPRRAAANDLE